MKKLMICLALCALGAGTNAFAVTIVGGAPCGTWMLDRANKNDDWPAQSNMNWLVGYLSGLSMGFNLEALAGAKNESLALWMDNYCKANPLNFVADGALKLFLELVKSKQVASPPPKK